MRAMLMRVLGLSAVALVAATQATVEPVGEVREVQADRDARFATAAQVAEDNGPALGIVISEARAPDGALARVDSPADLPFPEVTEQGSMSMCGRCDGATGDDCGMSIGHEAWPDSEGLRSEGDGWHSWCVLGTCGEKHPATCDCYCEVHNIPPEECEFHCIEDPGSLATASGAGGPEGPTFLDTQHLPEVWTGIRSRVLSPVTVAERYFNVEMNRERRALQVLGCFEEVVAHLPLPALAEDGDGASVLGN